MKIMERDNTKMTGDEMDSALGGVSDAQVGGGSKDDSHLEAVGQGYALDGTIKQMTNTSRIWTTTLNIFVRS